MLFRSTVVEWGEGLAESLAPSRLEIKIRHAESAPGADPEIEPRVVEVQGIGPRWANQSNRPTIHP